MMDKNPYDPSIDWLQPQYPASRQGSRYTSQNQQEPTHPAIKKAASTKQARMSKQRALDLVDSLKKGIIVSSIVSFGLLGGLVTGHAVGTVASSTKTSMPVTSNSSSSSNTPSNSGSSSSSSNSSSSNNSGSSTSQGGFSFGSSSSQSSVSGTSVS